MGREASSLRRAGWRLAVTKQGDTPTSGTAAADHAGQDPQKGPRGSPLLLLRGTVGQRRL